MQPIGYNMVRKIQLTSLGLEKSRVWTPIKRIKVGENIVEDTDEIIEEIRKYYKQLFTPVVRTLTRSIYQTLKFQRYQMNKNSC